MKKVKVVSPCLHRFCAKCIEEHIRKLCVVPLRSPNVLNLDVPLVFPAAAIPRVWRDHETTRLTCEHRASSLFPRTLADSNNYCPTCRVHIPSRRALRDDPDFDATVTTLYANAGDYDRAENAYSAHVTKQSMAAEKKAREQERMQRKIRAEQAAKQAAEMREKYRAEAEARASAKAERDAAAKAEREAAAAERAALAEAAAEAAVEATRRRLEEEHAESALREKMALARENALGETRTDSAEADARGRASEKAADVGDAEKTEGAVSGIAGATPRAPARVADAADGGSGWKPVKKLGRSSGKDADFGRKRKESVFKKNNQPSFKKKKAAETEKASRTPLRAPAATSKPVVRAGVAVVEMPDDFEGLYAMRVGDDVLRLRGEATDRYRVELKRLPSDGGVGLVAAPHVLFPGRATVDAVRGFISQAANIPRESVRVFSQDAHETDALDPSTTVADAVAGQVSNGSTDLVLRYSAT